MRVHPGDSATPARFPTTHRPTARTCAWRAPRRIRSPRHHTTAGRGDECLLCRQAGRRWAFGNGCTLGRSSWRTNSGERVALVVVDLGMVSLVLHRRVADRTLRSGTGIGADRLLLSATHTHSGPGNFFAADGYNVNAGRFIGFDPVVTDFLIDGIAGAIEDAASDLQPAQAGWRFEPVWDFTFNRSYEAYERNTSPRVTVNPASARRLDQQAVDSTFALLRVDRCDQQWENCAPRGAYGVFPIHSSNIPASNNLFDSDIHGVIARTVETHIREVRSGAAGSASAGRDCRQWGLLSSGSGGPR